MSKTIFNEQKTRKFLEIFSILTQYKLSEISIIHLAFLRIYLNKVF